MSTQTPSSTQIRAAWDSVADGFDRHVTPHTIRFGEQVLEPLSLGPGIRVLDVGAGSGVLSIPAARTGADVVAVDVLRASNPIAGQLTAGLTADQTEQFRLVLDGMLRERSGGTDSVTLRSSMRIGHATV